MAKAIPTKTVATKSIITRTIPTKTISTSCNENKVTGKMFYSPFFNYRTTTGIC